MICLLPSHGVDLGKVHRINANCGTSQEYITQSTLQYRKGLAVKSINDLPCKAPQGGSKMRGRDSPEPSPLTTLRLTTHRQTATYCTPDISLDGLSFCVPIAATHVWLCAGTDRATELHVRGSRKGGNKAGQGQIGGRCPTPNEMEVEVEMGCRTSGKSTSGRLSGREKCGAGKVEAWEGGGFGRTLRNCVLYSFGASCTSRSSRSSPVPLL